eukprot:577926-Pelagomonas_calceolata.AAC.8
MHQILWQIVSAAVSILISCLPLPAVLGGRQRLQACSRDTSGDTKSSKICASFLQSNATDDKSKRGGFQCHWAQGQRAQAHSAAYAHILRAQSCCFFINIFADFSATSAPSDYWVSPASASFDARRVTTSAFLSSPLNRAGGS